MGRLAMASYLRSVVGRASERLVSASNIENKPHDNQAEEIRLENATIKTEDLEPTAVGVYEDTVSSSGTIDEIQEDDETQFSVHFEPIASQPRVDKVSSERGQWAYSDVMLQPDVDGLGLTLSVRHAPQGLGLKEEEDTVVVVSSFRRLHAQDVGPAEASGQVHVHDVLWSIDGECVTTLEAVATFLSRQSTESGFYLIRFLRRSDVMDNQWSATDAVSLANVAQGSGSKTVSPDVAMLIRELVTRNQHLEEQLIASRLKQDEQRIQLDQLHALYAKTQLENWSTFSFPKPFNRRVSSDTSTPAGGTTRLSSAAARLVGANATQYDVEFAVHAAQERFARKLEQQLEIQKNELEATYTTQLKAFKAVADKKIRMLEHGIKQLLTSTTTKEECVSDNDVAPVEVSPYVLALRHQLLHRPAKACDPSNARRDCLLCMVEVECKDFLLQLKENPQDEWRGQVTALLDEYAIIKANRDKLLQEFVPVSDQVQVSLDAAGDRNSARC